jgi:hypothetical protein
VVTVDRPPEQVLPDGRLPAPLARLGAGVQVDLRPAPGGRGTELAARAPDGGFTGMAAHLVGDDPDLLVRRALREARQLVETGEPLRADRPDRERPGEPRADRPGGEWAGPGRVTGGGREVPG